MLAVFLHNQVNACIHIYGHRKHELCGQWSRVTRLHHKAVNHKHILMFLSVLIKLMSSSMKFQEEANGPVESETLLRRTQQCTSLWFANPGGCGVTVVNTTVHFIDTWLNAVRGRKLVKVSGAEGTLTRLPWSYLFRWLCCRFGPHYPKSSSLL